MSKENIKSILMEVRKIVLHPKTLDPERWDEIKEHYDVQEHEVVCDLFEPYLNDLRKKLKDLINRALREVRNN